MQDRVTPTKTTLLRASAFGGAIALAHFAFKLNAILAFWLAYILTRPLGASIGDFMSQHDKTYGGLGLGTTKTSYIFLGAIFALVVAARSIRTAPLPNAVMPRDAPRPVAA